MLEDNYSAKISELLATLPCQVRLPSEWGDYFAQEGMLASIGSEVRRFARKHFRTKAILEINATLPAIPRQQLVHAVYTRNISRGGIAFLHSAQLYPGESGRLWLADRRFQIDVVRCSRINSQCYEVGATI